METRRYTRDLVTSNPENMRFHSHPEVPNRYRGNENETRTTSMTTTTTTTIAQVVSSTHPGTRIMPSTNPPLRKREREIPDDLKVYRMHHPKAQVSGSKRNLALKGQGGSPWSSEQKPPRRKRR